MAQYTMVIDSDEMTDLMVTIADKRSYARGRRDDATGERAQAYWNRQMERYTLLERRLMQANVFTEADFGGEAAEVPSL